MRRRLATLLAAIVLPAIVAASASAAPVTLTVAPGATREALPCTPAQPCQYIWASETATSGDTVQFESGLYTLDGTVHTDSIGVSDGVTLEPAPGATRPVIRQTVAFPSCNCATLSIYPGVVVEDMQVEQDVAPGAYHPGAIGMSPRAGVERSIIIGSGRGIYLFEGEKGEAAGPGVSDSLIIANGGVALEDSDVEHFRLDNDTLIGRSAEVPGVALELHAMNLPTQAQATNTIFRGAVHDIEATGGTRELALTLHYSDARTSTDHVEGTKTTIQDTDHPQNGEPVFVSATDFHEAPGSPTVGAGTADPASGEHDLEGLPRSFLGATDIGAYQLEQASPAASTGSASSLTRTSAVVAGTLDPRGAGTSWHFEYGTTTAYGQSSAAQSLPAGEGAQPISTTLTGLAPGTTYHYRLVASNSSGAAVGADATLTTAPAAPVLSVIHLSHSRFKVSRKGGTLISYFDSQAATTTITVLERTKGVRSGKRCTAPPAHRKRGHRYVACSRFLARGTLTHVDIAGANSLHFTGRLHGKALRPGAYRLQLIAKSSISGLSPVVSASFTILR